ncbi:MAG: UDP-3-O-(3-hydroxymyristoyl)glucosamine N-acyltransferase, partial [Sneathiella sp.]
VKIYSGVRIGEDGFGFAPDPAGHIKIPQLGRVIIGSNVEIGANTTIDRGAGPDTIVGDNCWIDNLVQIAHNVRLGQGCIIAAQCGISGSTVLEDFVLLGGQVGLAGHITIGTGAQITAKSGVMSDIPAGKVYAGFPALPRKEFFRSIAVLRRFGKDKGSKA